MLALHLQVTIILHIRNNGGNQATRRKIDNFWDPTIS